MNALITTSAMSRLSWFEVKTLVRIAESSTRATIERAPMAAVSLEPPNDAVSAGATTSSGPR
ncbi:hypothetical protein [Streptomyces sp. NPDC001635]|nr:hypothetical protein E4K10_03265 [Streptomyces sp. T1317-0309]